jgi:hypothetical protein
MQVPAELHATGVRDGRWGGHDEDVDQRLAGRDGLAIGYLVGSNPRWRFDIALDRYVQPIRETELQLEADRIHLKETLSATRLAVSVGVEL